MKSLFAKLVRSHSVIPLFYGNYATYGELDGYRFSPWLSFVAVSNINMSADNILYLSGDDFRTIDIVNLSDNDFTAYMNTWDTMNDFFFGE